MSCHRLPRDSPAGKTWTARCRRNGKARRSHVLIQRESARGCFSSAFPKARSSRTGCTSTCGSALAWSVDERVAALEAECERLLAFGAARVELLPADGFDEACLV